MCSYEHRHPPGDGSPQVNTDTQSVKNGSSPAATSPANGLPVADGNPQDHASQLIEPEAKTAIGEESGIFSRPAAETVENRDPQHKQGGAWVFDRKAYERDMRLMKIRAKWRAYVALACVGVAACLLGYAVLDRVDKTGSREVPKARSPVITPIPSKKLLVEPQEAAKARETIERAVRGELDQATIQSFRHVPEFNRCRQCFAECEKSAIGTSEVLLQDCRRNCLRDCSETARQLMDR